ncbi:MAG: enoyl-CoA hydratase/isomerase family protein [Deltaproteobacteria bacterium]|nr:enoyl-CoA hydratase/isomerase family protein [Deltaproteobacteria bacterium]
MSYENILFETAGPIGRLTVNRPKLLNALNRRTLSEIADCAKAAAQDRSLRALIVTGAGEKAFVAGADISEMTDFPREAALEFSRDGHRAMDAIAAIPFPVIAQVNGFALGGGLELALACDVIFAADTAKLGLPEVTLGLLPGFGGTQRLSRRVGPGKARELTYSGEHIPATEALRIHLVDRVYPAAELGDACTKWAELVATRGPCGIALAKEAIETGSGLTLADGLRIEQHLFSTAFTTQDMREGTQAFLAKRKADFKGN